VIVLDSSALLAGMFGEAGAGRVAAALGRSMMSTVNAAEVLGRLARDGHDVAEAAGRLAETPIAFEPFDWDQARIAARLEPVGRSFGLSLGHRACLALAIARILPVLTADRAWAGLDLPVEVEVIR
jgi:PIN domain nuclease of toxin-antitoxin system